MIIQVRDRSIKTYASTEHCCICNSVALVKTSSVLCEVNILFDTCGVRNGGVRMENFKNFCQVKKNFVQFAVLDAVLIFYSTSVA